MQLILIHSSSLDTFLFSQGGKSEVGGRSEIAADDNENLDDGEGKA